MDFFCPEVFLGKSGGICLIPIIASTYRQAHVCACVSVFASTHVISLGQLSVCLPVSLYEVSVCPRNAPRPICHWSYCSAHPTGALRLSCAVSWQVRNMCFSSFFPLLLSVFAHVLG